MNTNPVNSNDLLKFAAAVGLFGLWGVLVFLGKVPPIDLVEGIKAALLGLGIFHTTQAQAAASPVPPPPALPASITLKESP